LKNASQPITYHVKRAGCRAAALCLLAGVATLLGVQTAPAQSGTWTYTAGGNVNWTDSTKWAGGIVATGANNTAQFSGINITANTIVNVDAGRTISDILTGDTSQSQEWTFTGGPLNLANTTIQPQIRVLQNSATFNTVITGTDGLRKEQAGVLVLSATNTYTGDTSINRGTLRFGSSAAIPSGPGYGDVYMNFVSGAPILDLSTFSPTINGLSSANGVGTVTSSAASGTNTLTVGANDATSTFSGAISNGATCTVGLTKTGSGTLTLSGSNNYGGTTTINGGTLVLIGTNVGAGEIQVLTGGTLAGSGGIAGAATISVGNISPGLDGAGILTFNGGLTINWSGAYVWQLAAHSTNNPGTDYDQIVVKGGNLDLGPARLKLRFTGTATTPDAGEPFWQSPRSWRIISLNGGLNRNSLSFSWVENAVYDAGWFWTAVDAGGSIVLNFTPGSLTPTVVDFATVSGRVFPTGVRGQPPHRREDNPGVAAMFAMSSPSLMRGIAGGLDADSYDWRDYNGGSLWGAPIWGSWITSLDFLRKCRDTGSEPQFTANMFGGGYTNGSGTWVCQFDNHTNIYNPGGNGTNPVTGTAAQLAADWVRYCNIVVQTYHQGQEDLIGSDPNFNASENAENLRVYNSLAIGGDWGGRDLLLTNGEPAVPKVTWWEIGNEPEVNLTANSTLVTQHTISDKIVYRDRYRVIANAMKAVDSSIKTGPCITVAANSNEWLGRVAEDTNAPLDFIGIHPYYGILKYLWPNGTNMTAALLDLGRYIAAHASGTALTLSNYAGNTRFGTQPPGWFWTVPLFATEYNPVNWDAVSEIQRSTANALGILEHCFRFAHPNTTSRALQSFYGAVYWADPQGKPALTNAFEALRDFAGDLVLENPSPGPQPVPDFGLLGSPMRVYVTQQTNGSGKIHVWGLNFSEDQDQTINLSLLNLPFTPRAVFQRSFGKGGAENSLTNSSGLGWTVNELTGSVDPSNFTLTVENAGFSILTFQEYSATNWYWDTSASVGLRGGNGTWSTNSLLGNWSTSDTGENPWLGWADGKDAIFDAALSAGGTITVTGTVSPRAVFVNKANCNFAGKGTINLGAGGMQLNASSTITNNGGNPMLAGTGGVTINPGAGNTVTFNCTNTYSGKTVIASGTLTLGVRGGIPNGSRIALLNDATFNVTAKTAGFVLPSGQTLSGNGFVNGCMSINGTISPGALVGTLTFNTNLTLAGTTVMEVSRAGSIATNDLIACSRTLTYGGTLIVTNIDPDPLTVGDTFTLFTALTHSNSFSTLQLPPLTYGLGWNTNGLSSGVVQVVLTVPVFSWVAVLETNLVLSGSNGVFGSPYYLLTSTNVALPMSNWTRLLTNTFGSGGDFTEQISLDVGEPIRFYRLQTAN